MAGAVDSVAVVAVAPAESAIAGRRLTLIEQAKGCHESMAPFFCLFFADTSAEETSRSTSRWITSVSGGGTTMVVQFFTVAN